MLNQVVSKSLTRPVASRGYFDDPALESRFLTEDMGRRRLRDDISLSLPKETVQEAAHLRNKLLLFRFRNRGEQRPGPADAVEGLAPRLNQVFGPLLSLVPDAAGRTRLAEFMRAVDVQHAADRGLDIEAHVVEALRDLFDSGMRPVPVGKVAEKVLRKYGDQYDRRVTSRWIGFVIRRKLLLKTERVAGAFVVPHSERSAMRALCLRLGL